VIREAIAFLIIFAGGMIVGVWIGLTAPEKKR